MVADAALLECVAVSNAGGNPASRVHVRNGGGQGRLGWPADRWRDGTGQQKRGAWLFGARPE